MMKIRFDKYGYKIIGLMTKDRKQKTYKIHVIKAKAFLFSPNPLGYNVVRHLDDCKTNNRLINLAWGTASDNMKDRIRNENYNWEASTKGRAIGRAKGNAVSAKKRSKPVQCKETGIIYASAYEAERQTGIGNSHINSCCFGKRKTTGGYHWQFVDKQE